MSINSGVVGDDVSSGLISMGFNFPIGGQTYSSLYFSSNGFVNFTTASGSLSNAVPPTSNAPYPALIVYWDDLHPGYGGSSITYDTLGTAPNRRFVISYNNVSQYGNSAYRYTFQVALFESGNVEYRYQSMACCVSTASVGIQVSATDYASYGDVNTMPGGTAILWAARENSSPGGLSGHVWWGRAGTIGLADNADVVTWSNAANYAKNLTGSTTRPKYRNNNAQNINFNPVVEFTSATASDAAAQFFSAPSFLGASTWNQAHYALVGYPSSQRQGDRVLYEDAASPVGADGRLSIHWAWLDDRVFWDAGASGNGNRTFYLDTDVANKASIWLFNADTATASPSGSRLGIRRDGLAKATSGAPAAFTGINANFRVGYGGVDSTFRGVLAEGMLFLGNTMSNTQAAQLESYLGVKYGVTLGATQPRRRAT
ncbi:hypothetical protein [Ideonella paludis]|uniref:hypothetical protein n=1 Tax=Ideonella paludis TaxID=1233411 RepID=UPI00362EE91D